jgi:hypothetical protein
MVRIGYGDTQSFFKRRLYPRQTLLWLVEKLIDGAFELSLFVYNLDLNMLYQ